MRKLRQRGIYIGLVGAYAVVIFFWWRNSGVLFAGTPIDQMLAVGRLLGLTAVYQVLVQFLLIGRSPWLEQSFGLDRLTRLHRLNGRLIPLVILAHPLLIIPTYSSSAGPAAVLEFALTDPRLLAAYAAYWGLMLVVISSLVIVRRHLKYEWWYRVHLLMYAVIALAFFHQLAYGGDFIAQPVFAYYWIMLYLLVFGSLAIFRVIRPLWHFSRHQFTVQRVVAESPTTTSVYISGQDLGAFKVKPGQFAKLRFLDGSRAGQSHPFSISSAPGSEHLRITVRDSGDFTHDLKNVQAGTKVLVEGPFGVFTADAATLPKVLLVAGGVGITPLRTLAEQLLRAGRDVIMLYSNRSAADVPLKAELDALAAQGMGLQYVMSDDPAWPGETGQLTAASIQRLVPDVAEREVYVCGPPPMIAALRRGLAEIGVPKSQLHYELFSLV